ncbi:GTP pyrophosphokinase [Wohlfahrtiimonas chitiniclastica]|uniref:GTP pyrophosphokinase n=1 Tax=Wohlfahrtiimonas chitiniclastica TaxID=400946 RepID=UPI001BD0D9C2|nr:GTP pyrophosphokinase [Wohlfahrtiimonas chitiniclastica]MBS7816713.1 GTP pyrophosphokinase [Wohlfahrtiimonas chitiniclastica]MBS7822394.1 GTP pyrophosphokinase [Wohlfahrtiimonas chitiniclastica]MBS7830456.1 GTP pyrophosphokinase [Wohlfahrtiimonas chitiniclastica]MBS7832424.1 GTP pyrophosphokinase [Wohlfahrtiimonas chitiniclastica]
MDQSDLEFLQSHKISKEDFEKSTILIDTLQAIANDYQANYLTLLDEAEYIAKKIQRCKNVHSVRWRIKNTTHLLKKIIRKRNEAIPSAKYQDISVDNYKTTITDLIGVRAIYLFKNDWVPVHKHILSKWEIKEDEPIKIYHREGDTMSFYDDYDCNLEVHPYSYRSTHYIVPAAKIQSQPVYCEIQTRTIFEEGWSEIDHEVRYPDFSEDVNLISYLNVFNRLAGSADEMGSYVNDLVALIKKNKKLEKDLEERDAELTNKTQELQGQIDDLMRQNQSGQAKQNDPIHQKFQELINLQKQKIENLQHEIKLQATVENQLAKSPMVKILNQTHEKNDNTYSGEITLEITRPHSFASFTGQLQPFFSIPPNVEVILTKVEANDTKINDIKIRVGVGKTSDFNVHIWNYNDKNIEAGTYHFSYKAINK